MFSRTIRPVLINLSRGVMLRQLSTNSNNGSRNKSRLVTASVAAIVTSVTAGVAVVNAESSWWNPASWWPSKGEANYKALQEDIEALVLDKSCGPLLVRLAW